MEIHACHSWGNKTVTLFVDEYGTVLDLKKELQKKTGEIPEEILMTYKGKPLIGPVYLTPEYIDDKKKNVVCGEGDKSIKVFFVNSKRQDIDVTFKFPSFSSKDMNDSYSDILGEFVKKVEKGLKHEYTLTDWKISLYCGDKLVYCCGTDVENAPKFSLDFLFVRNDPWYVFIRGVFAGKELYEFRFEKNTTVYYRQRGFGPHVSYGKILNDYTPKSSKKCDGINIEGTCISKNCKFSQKKVVIPYSQPVIMKGGEKYLVGEPFYSSDLTEGEYFDIDYDLKMKDYYTSHFKCPGCTLRIKNPEKFYLQDCFWKFSSIITDKSNQTKRIESNWKQTSKNNIFDYCEFQKKYEDNIQRFQIQVRFYRVKSGVFANPNSSFCMLCTNRVKFVKHETVDALEIPEEDDTFEKMEECDHWFHKSCLSEFKERSTQCMFCKMKKDSKIVSIGDEFEKERIEFLILLILQEKEVGFHIDLDQSVEFLIPKFFMIS